MTDTTAVEKAMDKLRPRCPICSTALVSNPLSYALHGTQGYRAKCPRCGTRVVMAWAPLSRALRREGRLA